MNDMRRMRPAGYVPETRNGRTLHRVRVEGEKRRRITIPVGPEDPAFWEHYYAARAGQTVEAPTPARAARTLATMCAAYLAWLDAQVAAGTMSSLTLIQRRSLLGKVCAMPDDTGALTMGDYDPALPPSAMLHIQDQWGALTGQADNSLKALSAAYIWAVPRGWCDHNPAAGIKRVHQNRGGATAWTPDDMQKFLGRHGPGTMPRLWLFLVLFTGARLADLAILGRGHEVQRAGMTWLEWQPGKRGSAPVSLPIAPQLHAETRAAPVVGPTYLLNAKGQPFGSSNVLGNAVQDWTAAAGLSRRSSHGLRKSLGGLLADAGATQHQIMAVMAHTNAKTSEIYTRSAERSRMAAAAIQSLAGLRIG